MHLRSAYRKLDISGREGLRVVQGPVQGERPSPMRPRDGMLGGMHVDEYTQHDATGLRALIAGGEVSADEVETAAREALDAANARVNGLAALPFTPALDHDPDGPLAGVPFLYKDVGPMAAGVPFYGGCARGPGHPPRPRQRPHAPRPRRRAADARAHDHPGARA